MISLALIAKAHGAKIGEKNPSPGGVSAPISEPDPQALMGFLGQARPIPYQAPKRGLLLN